MVTLINREAPAALRQGIIPKRGIHISRGAEMASSMHVG